MGGASGNEESRGKWELLGGNKIRAHEHPDGGVERLISVPRDVIELIFQGPDEDNDGTAYWAYEKEQGWIILSDEKLDGDLLKLRNLNSYTLRNNNSVRIPNVLFNTINKDKLTLEQGVLEHVALAEGDTYHFFTWSTWGEGRPNAVILVKIESLGIPGPDQQGNMGGTSGPKFGGGGGIDLPEAPNFELKAADDSNDSNKESESDSDDSEAPDDELQDDSENSDD